MRDWLKDIRMEKDLTQSKVAEKANIERAYYTMIELGARKPSVTVAKSIARVLNFNWTLFFEEKSNETLRKTNSA
ncbi:helix-turn-helix transcriptional regulator [Priestia filamentosa]|uniref:helix-turn-helix transcriptional regulator n=1 Tax=Priestia filamentosa TaxID=1402861 RepID=UPI000A0900E7|nr:helix-turn-helix transcriptional regulator [Priestia filamentosa]OXS69872.1 transcriptional regulator [Priestia filamentosa]SMF37423.1 DNA-binding transcriptional regulator, XRE-family HTH domain [Priestia filamentosa]